LIKIKVGGDFKDEDLLWAISHQGGDNVDLEDMKNIVTVLNQKGLWSPLLSEKRTTWKSLKNSADCKALGQFGSPILLLEGVSTFKQVLGLAYKRGILDDVRGWDILAMKDEEILGNTQQPRLSQTLEDALSEPESVNRAMLQSSELVSNMGSGNSDSVSKAGGQLGGSREIVVMDKTGTFKLPSPVPVSSIKQYGVSAEQAKSDQIPLVIVQDDGSSSGYGLDLLAQPGSSSSTFILDSQGGFVAATAQQGVVGGDIGANGFLFSGVTTVAKSPWQRHFRCNH
jgi:hypothetical protein